MGQVKVSFVYEPDEPDEADSTGVSSDEYELVTGKLMEMGAENIQFEKA